MSLKGIRKARELHRQIQDEIPDSPRDRAIETLLQEIDRLHALLKELEWQKSDGWVWDEEHGIRDKYICPLCRGDKYIGHKDECKLGRAMERLKE